MITCVSCRFCWKCPLVVSRQNTNFSSFLLLWVIKTLFPALLCLLRGWLGAAGVRSSPFRGWGTGLWHHDLNTDEITGKLSLRYCFRTSFILLAFRLQVLQVTESWHETGFPQFIKQQKGWPQRSRTYRCCDDLICRACSTDVIFHGEGRSKCLCYQAHSLLLHSDQGQVLHDRSGTLELGLTDSLLLFLSIRLSRRWSGGTTGRMQIAMAAWALSGLCLFSLGPLLILTFSWSTSIIDKLFSAGNIPPETLQTALKSRLTNN